MILEEGLLAHLTADAGIVAMAGGRIYWTELPQGSGRPALTFERQSTDHDENARGSSGIAAATVRITSWSQSWAEARRLADLVRLAMQGQRATTWGEIGIGAVQSVADLDGFDLSSGDIYISSDYEIWFYEPTEA